MRKMIKKSVFTQKHLETNIIDLASERATRICRIVENHQKGTHTLGLVIEDETSQSGERRLDLSALLSFPNLWKPFSGAILQKATTDKLSISSMSSRCDGLKNFLEYLRSINAYSYSIGEVTTTVIEGYILWLDRPNQDGTALYSTKTKVGYFSVLRVLIANLQASNTWSNALAPDLHLRSRIWSRGPENKTIAPVILDSNYSASYKACKKEIVATMERVLHLRSIMEANMSHPVALLPDAPRSENLYYPGSGRPIREVWANNPYKDLGLLLATLRHRNPDLIIRTRMLYSLKDEFLVDAARSNKVHGGVSAYEQCFYPSPRDLIPFVVMMAIHLDYNPDTLLKSKISDYRIQRNEYDKPEFVAPIVNDNEDDISVLKSLLHEEADFKAFARKGRAKNKRQEQIRPATNDPDNPASIWQFIIEWTKYIRPYLTAGFRDRLFVFVPATKKRDPRGFAASNGNASSDCAWAGNLVLFYQNNNLAYHPLKSFRIKGLDISDILFEGDIRAKQAAGNHTHPDTTYRHYKTPGQKQRGDEYLAQISQGRQRWRETNGKVDIRNMPDGTDLGAATPGWTCSDPFNPPNGPDGKLCMNFGQCPNCPHGSIDRSNPYCYAQAWNLLAAIDEAASTMAPESWVKRWSPVKGKLLQHWLPCFPKPVIEEAKNIRLRPLPPLE